MDRLDTDWIAKRAYAIWEEEGRPEGRHDSHWRMAVLDFEAMQETVGALAGLPEEPAEPKKKKVAVKSSKPKEKMMVKPEGIAAIV